MNEKLTVNVTVCIQSHIHISTYGRRTYRAVHAHECTYETPRVGIDGTVNIRTVRLVD